MHIDPTLEKRLDQSFEDSLVRFLKSQELIDPEESILSDRFLNRSLAPHVKRLSSLFNRIEADNAVQGHYWKDVSNRNHFLAAYFLYFMPGNLYRMASVFSELHRLGYRVPGQPVLRAIDFGSGPGTATCGFALADSVGPLGYREDGRQWALIEKDRKILELAEAWIPEFQVWLNAGSRPDVRTFHRTLDLKRGLLPRTAPKFNLWTMSFVLNEWSAPPQEIAEALLEGWKKHLDDEGLVVLVEPALKIEARKLQTVREHLLPHLPKVGMKTLLPCMGERNCGALAREEDWCHEIVSWWRPPSLQKMDKLVGLDRKTLPLSYWILAKSERPLSALLPALGDMGSAPETLGRVVSPVRALGRDLECYLCTPNGKTRCRIRKDSKKDHLPLERGSVVQLSTLSGDANATRLDASGLRVWPATD